jgi:hypothetical protein
MVGNQNAKTVADADRVLQSEEDLLDDEEDDSYDADRDGDDDEEE